jgi:hypothetical protein
MTHLKRAIVCTFLLASPLFASSYKSFRLAIFVGIESTRQWTDPQKMQADFDAMSAQIKFDKIYLETASGRQRVDEPTIDPIKKFFQDKGIQVSGALALNSNGGGGSQSATLCYTDPSDREYCQKAVEESARHFDEIILDDWFFNSTKRPSDIAAKGSKTWTQFRLETMDEAAQNLVLKPGLAVNPKVNIILKYPNWYEHYQGLGYDLEQEPKLFNEIYTGTETRDPLVSEQHLQPYQSYGLVRYLENIKPGGNGGGWIDPYGLQYIDRWPEQLWDTAFAKAREITLYKWSSIAAPIRLGDRPWQAMPTSFDYQQLVDSYSPIPNGGGPKLARAAGYALEQVDPLISRLGNPIGIKGYRPPHAWAAEEFLYDYLGMVGIPLDLSPTFPTGADVCILNASASADPDIVKKIKAQLSSGKIVVITSGLVKALQGQGIEDICEFQYTNQKAAVTAFQGLGGLPIGENAKLDSPITIPIIRFLTNDSWARIAGVANGTAYPILLSDAYDAGTLYVLTIPDNFNDLYNIPAQVLSTIKRTIMRDFPVRIDAPGQISLFTYDNNTFVVQSFLPTDSAITIITTPGHTRLRDLRSDRVINAEVPTSEPTMRSPVILFRRREFGPPRPTFPITLRAHSYMVFSIEK